MVAELDQGEVTITTADNTVERFFVAGGYVEVESNRVTLLADVIERASEIDKNRAQTARKRAAERLANIGPDTDLERANRALRRADQRLQMSQSTSNH
jgi:F-type H+-transporting ATPase subunit epsilon